MDIDSKFFLENLQKRSVIKQSKQDGNYKIHRVVQTVIRSSMSNEQIVEFSKSLFSVAEKIIPSTTVDFQAYKKAQVILDGIDYISSLELPISVEIASLLLISGSANLQWGSDKLAEKHLKLAQKFKPQNPDEQLLHARIKSSEGWLLGNQHKYHEAIIAFKSTIIDLENMAGTPNNAENVILSQVYNNMGRAYQFLAQRENDKSQFPLASEALKKSLKLVKSIYGELSTDYGQKLNNIAMLHLAMGKNQQALLEITQARNITQTVLGNENPTLGIRLRNLAHIQHFNSLDMEALPNIRKAWDLLESPNKDKPDRRTVVLVTYALVSKGISEKEYSDACQKLYDILIIEKFNIGQDAMNILVSYLQNSKQIILLAKVYFLRFYKGYGKKSLQT